MRKRLTKAELVKRERYIKSSALKKLGATKTYFALRDLGIGGRKTDVLKAYREFGKIPKKQKSIAHVTDLKRIGHGDYNEQSKFFTQAFRYTMRFTLYRPDTGEEVKWHTTMSNPTEMRPGQIKAEGMKALAKWGAFYRFTIRKAAVYEAEHDPTQPWD